MVTLEQIRQLDARVHRAVELIGKLRDENTTLKNRLSEYQGRIEELDGWEIEITSLDWRERKAPRHNAQRGTATSS